MYYKIGGFIPSFLLNLFFPIDSERFSSIYVDSFSNVIKIVYSTYHGENRYADVFVLNKNTNLYENIGSISKFLNHAQNPLNTLQNTVAETLSSESLKKILDTLDNMPD